MGSYQQAGGSVAKKGVEMLYCKRGSFQRKICFLLFIFDNSAVERNKKGGSTLYI
jgi:hypothetical protein